MAQKKNHIAYQELKEKKKLKAGLISNRFPKVSAIVLSMNYYQRLSDSVYLMRTVNFSPPDHAYFLMDCLTKDCLNGGFELTPVITDMIKKRKTAVKGKLICSGKDDTGTKGHLRITYEVRVKYKRNSR